MSIEMRLTISEFSKLYREYANEVKENKRPAVDRSAWKHIKNLLINNKRLTEVVVDLNCISLNDATGTCGYFHKDTRPGLNGFLDFIYEKNENMSLNNQCNCADLTSITDWALINSAGNIWTTDTAKIVDSSWNTGTINLTDNYSDLNNKITNNKEEIDKHNKRISHLETSNDEVFCQANRNANDIENLFVKVNDTTQEVKRQEGLIHSHQRDIDNLYQRQDEIDINRVYEDIGRHDWMITTTDNALHKLIKDSVVLTSRLDELSETIANYLNPKTTESDDNNKENKFMDMKFMNFDFGKVNSDAIRMSMYGLAIKNVNGTYVSYDAKNHSVMDVEIMNVPGGDLFYKMPVAIKDVKAGDIVIHNKVPMFVIEVHTSTIKVIDIREGTEKEIYLTKNMFGFNYATKVVSLMDMMGGNMKPTTDNPFGNIGMLMLMSGDNDMKDVLPMLMLSGNTNFASNPMLMYFMMKDGGKMDDMLPLMLLMNQPTATEQKM